MTGENQFPPQDDLHERRYDIQQKPVTPYIVLAERGDELTLRDVWRILVKKAWLIVGIVGVALLAAVLFVYTVPPKFRAAVYYLPPLPNNTGVLNFGGVGKEYGVDDLYARFQLNFVARDNLWQFYDENKLYEYYLGEGKHDPQDIAEVFEEEFIADLRLNRTSSKKDNTESSNATFDWFDAKQGALLLSKYSDWIRTITQKQFGAELLVRLDLKRREMQDQIDALRQSSEITKKMRLAVLDENIAIAKKLNIKRSVLLNQEPSSDVITESAGNVALYQLGYEILEAEKQMLLERKDNDPFIPGLDALLKSKIYLDNIKPPVEELQVVRVARGAVAGSKPVWPNKALIIALSLLSSLALSILFVIVSNSLSRGNDARS